VTTVGFLGTGLMGAPMAARLVEAGFRVFAWNRTADKLGPLLAAGVVAAASPAQAVADADFICMALADAKAVENVLFGAGGVAASGRPPQLVVDFSTLDPAVTRTLAARLDAQCGVRWVDSPVSGGVKGATEGKLVAFCGGEEADVTRARPVLSPLMSRVNHLGPLGAGQATKLCNQLIVATNVMAIAEALSLARACGLDMRQLPDALTGGFADSLPLQIFGRRMAAGVTTPKLGEISLMLKDVQAAVTAADGGGSPSPLARRVLQMYRRARELRFDGEDLGALLRLYEHRE
jgi:3-hydroxyisobutyrate dehydrogenase-like beta-hydroxyacid dehydrogenase